jgi:trimeric autotransporter adhesin
MLALEDVSLLVSTHLLHGSAVTGVAPGSVVTLTAAVTAGGSPLTAGQVNFCAATATYCTDIHLLGTAQLTSAGTAVVNLRPGIGAHSYKAVFVGTTNYVSSASSASALSVTGPYTTTTTVAKSGSPGNYALTATVVGAVDSSSVASPTGSVSFLDTTDNWPGVIVTGDFNGDGILDLAVTNATSKNVSILRGLGGGAFAAQLAYIPLVPLPIPLRRVTSMETAYRIWLSRMNPVVRRATCLESLRRPQRRL